MKVKLPRAYARGIFSNASSELSPPQWDPALAGKSAEAKRMPAFHPPPNRREEFREGGSKLTLLFAPLLIYALSFSNIFTNKVFALEFAGLALSPPTFELSANPGDSLENTIKVENLTDAPLTLAVDRRNFIAIGEEGSVGLTEEQTTFSLASWIAVSPSEFVIPAKAIKIVNFRITVPANAEPGGHFGSIVFRTTSTTPTQSGAALVQELGSLVLLRVAGKTTELASIEGFSPKKFFWEYGPVEFDLRIKNEGSVHVKPQGTITITNFFGQKIGSGVVELEPKNVLPGAVRKNTAAWNKKWLFGKYTAVVSLTYGTKPEILTASTTFVGFPAKIGGVIFLAVLIIGLFLYRGRKRIRLALRILFSGK